MSKSEIKYHAIVHVGRWYTLQGFLQFSPTNVMLAGLQDHSGKVTSASGELEIFLIGDCWYSLQGVFTIDQLMFPRTQWQGGQCQ